MNDFGCSYLYKEVIMNLRRPRGTRDYLPAEMCVRRRIFERIREVFESYGYGEVQTPAFEHLELLEAKAGEEVKEQIYWFKDKAGRKLGLRFELTTSIARVVASNPVMPKPIRFYYIQPVWRYEEPQRGRLREFYHAGIELIGVKSPSADAEVIAVTCRSLKNCGLEDIKVKVNDRRIVETLLREFGISEANIETGLRILDKLEKRGRDFVIKELSKVGVSSEHGSKLIEILGSKGSNEEKLEKIEKCVKDWPEGVSGSRNLRMIIEELYDGYGFSEDTIDIDFSIVRGLAYYTGFVFEVKAERSLDIGSVAGGGRYDNLIGLIGGRDMPATGMAIGVERLIEALRNTGNTDLNEYRISEVIVIPLGDKCKVEAIKVAETLRDEGIPTVLDVTGRRISSALEYADKMKIRYAIIVGEREIREGKYTLKNLEKWEERKLSLKEILEGIIRGKL
ncbi:MAG: histidine--tRNA ligase [Thermoprotei archaeon]|nr:MAG: histidine--tRNA ligase [Thermoprotei archaeon]